AGINLSQVDGDMVWGFKHVGFNGGPSVMFPFGKDKKWSATMELLFSQEGSYEKNPEVNSTGMQKPYYKLNLDYVQIPLMIHYKDKDIIAGGLGLSYGQLVNVKEIQHGIRTETNLQGPYTKGDLQGLLDIRLRLYKRLWFDFRYSYSFLKIRTRYFDNTFNQWTRDQYNNVITLRLSYIFNEPLPFKEKKKVK
ncbi:MAG: porin family protein, partial [Bacteroidota bacterium]|nr:porin family protein [Bacteroidota bacterium]